jgi:uroporphyrinogen decarboxylase
MGDQADYYGTWDDVAGQEGMMFSPDLFRSLFLPWYRRLIDQNKKRGLLFGWHVCGSVHEVLPMMIDAGIDVFDVVQTSARDMDIENVHRLYGRHVCLHGGLDVQKLLVEKTDMEVREEVQRIVDLWGNRGGIILAPSHETLPDTPPENVLAIYESFKDT